jgi:hypothetical protein
MHIFYNCCTSFIIVAHRRTASKSCKLTRVTTFDDNSFNVGIMQLRFSASVGVIQCLSWELELNHFWGRPLGHQMILKVVSWAFLWIWFPWSIQVTQSETSWSSAQLTVTSLVVKDIERRAVTALDIMIIQSALHCVTMCWLTCTFHWCQGVSLHICRKHLLLTLSRRHNALLAAKEGGWGYFFLVARTFTRLPLPTSHAYLKCSAWWWSSDVSVYDGSHELQLNLRHSSHTTFSPSSYPQSLGPNENKLDLTWLEEWITSRTHSQVKCITLETTALNPNLTWLEEWMTMRQSKPLWRDLKNGSSVAPRIRRRGRQTTAMGRTTVTS